MIFLLEITNSNVLTSTKFATTESMDTRRDWGSFFADLRISIFDLQGKVEWSFIDLIKSQTTISINDFQYTLPSDKTATAYGALFHGLIETDASDTDAGMITLNTIAIKGSNSKILIHKATNHLSLFHPLFDAESSTYRRKL